MIEHQACSNRSYAGSPIVDYFLLLQEMRLCAFTFDQQIDNSGDRIWVVATITPYQCDRRFDEGIALKRWALGGNGDSLVAQRGFEWSHQRGIGTDDTDGLFRQQRRTCRCRTQLELIGGGEDTHTARFVFRGHAEEANGWRGCAVASKAVNELCSR